MTFNLPLPAQMSAKSKRKWSPPPDGPLEESLAKKQHTANGAHRKEQNTADRKSPLPAGGDLKAVGGANMGPDLDGGAEGKLSEAIAAALGQAVLRTAIQQITMKQILDALAPQFGVAFLKQHKHAVIKLVGEQFEQVLRAADNLTAAAQSGSSAADAAAAAPSGSGAAAAPAAAANGAAAAPFGPSGSGAAAAPAAAANAAAAAPLAVRWDSDASTKRHIRALAGRLAPSADADRISRAIIESKFMVVGDYVEFAAPGCLLCRGQVVKVDAESGEVRFRQIEDMYSEDGRQCWSVRRPDGTSFPDADLIGYGPASDLARFPRGTFPTPRQRPANAKPSKRLLADGLRVVKAEEGDEYSYMRSVTLTFEDESTLEIGAATWYNTKTVTRDKPDDKEDDFDYLRRLISRGLLRFRRFSVHDDEGERESDPFLGADFENGLEITASGDPEGNFSGHMTVRKGGRESNVTQSDCD